MTQTNANNLALAQDLALAKRGTFTGLVIRKVGKEVRGVRYGDDLVHAVIITGFSYLGLIERSKAILDALTEADLQRLLSRKLTGFAGRGKNAVSVPVTLQDFRDAMAEMSASFQKTLDGVNVSTTDHVYEPLVVDGEIVRGARVYTGDPSLPLAAPVGTIYLQGLQVGSKVLDAAPNGPAPRPQSAPLTVAKGALSGLLPCSRYVSYKLEANQDWILQVGGMAAVAADKDGVSLDQKKVDEVRVALLA